MGGLELILLGLLPAALLAGLAESKLLPQQADDTETSESGEAPAGSDLLDYADGPGPTAQAGSPHLQDAQGAGAQGPAPSPAADATDPLRAVPEDYPEFQRHVPDAPNLGSAGSDTLNAGEGGNVVLANGFDSAARAGNTVTGGPGDDTLLGGAGSDTLSAPAGNNIIRASYDLNLELSQGSDLFIWRDNGLPDILEGGAGDDRLIFARGDVATGGGGANVFEVWHDPGSAQPSAMITDFDPGKDRLDVVMRIDEADHPDCGTWAWDAEVEASVFEPARPEIAVDAETGRTDVLVDGETVARLLGAPQLTAEQIRIFAFWDITT